MNTTASSTLSISSIVARTSVITVALAMPFVVHLLPSILGAPVGAVLLPMFYAPLIAAAWRMKSVTGIALSLPLVNMLLVGHPDPVTTLILTFEVGLFLLVAWNRDTLNLPSWLTGAAAYLAAKAASLVAISMGLLIGFEGISPIDFLVQSISTGWPGLLLVMISGLIFNRKENFGQ